MKKNLLVAAIAAFVAQGAFATPAEDGDISSKNHSPVSYASETFVANDDGYQEVDVDAIQAINMPLGFTLPAGEKRYIRISLDDALFNDEPVLAGPAATATQGAAIIDFSQGGDGENFVIFEISAPADDSAVLGTLPNDIVLTLTSTDGYLVTEAETTISYALFETASQAVNNTQGTALSEESGALTSYSSVNTGIFSVLETEKAISQTNFVGFGSSTSPTFTGVLGNIKPALLLGPAGSPSQELNAADNSQVTVEDVVADNQTLTINGDFTFGTWTLESAAASQTACSTTTEVASFVISEDKKSATADITMSSANDFYLCLDNATTKEQMKKGDYIATLKEADLTATIGELTYNTQAIEINYITTDPGYTQRIFLLNNGSQKANFSTTFSTESGIEAEAKEGSSGTLEAGEYRMIKVTDFVEFTGGARGAATIEVESSDIRATTQTYNKDTGSTDTITLTPAP